MVEVTRRVVSYRMHQQKRYLSEQSPAESERSEAARPAAGRSEQQAGSAGRRAEAGPAAEPESSRSAAARAGDDAEVKSIISQSAYIRIFGLQQGGRMSLATEFIALQDHRSPPACAT